MKDMLLSMLTSKKWWAAAMGFTTMTVGYFGYEVDPVALMAIISPILLYLPSQGAADIGKEKVKAELANNPLAKTLDKLLEEDI